MSNGLRILPQALYEQRVESGIYVPHREDDFCVLDCGDRRPLTDEAQELRENYFGRKVTPARYFGASGGLAATAILAIMAKIGQNPYASVPQTSRAHFIADFAANISTRAANNQTGEIVVNQHGSDASEYHPSRFNQTLDQSEEVDCTFLTYLGAIALIAGEDDTKDEFSFLAKFSDVELPLTDIFNATSAFSSFNYPDLTVHRGALQHTMKDRSLRTPFVVLDSQAPASDVKVIYDFAGNLADARTTANHGLPDYHHDVTVPAHLLPRLLPEMRLSEEHLIAAGLLIGAATRRALGRLKDHDVPGIVIPRSYALAS